MNVTKEITKNFKVKAEVKTIIYIFKIIWSVVLL